MNKILVLAVLLLLSTPMVNAEVDVNYFGEIRSMNMTYWVSYVDWSPDGTKIVSSDWNKNIQIWNRSDGELLNNLIGHSETVWTVKWSLDGTKIASASWDYSVRIWDSQTGDNLDIYNHNSQVYGLDWSPDGSQILTGNQDGKLILWDVSTGNPILNLTNHSDPVTSIEWSPDGTKIASGDWGGKLIVWNASTYEIIEVYDYMLNKTRSTPIDDISWSPDSSRIAAGGGGGVILSIINVLDGSRLEVNDEWFVSTWGISWSPDGKKIATSMSNGYVFIWNENGEKIRTLTGHLPNTDSYSEAVRWSPDGTKLANGANDNIVRIWGDLRDVISEQKETIQGQQNTLNNISSDVSRFEQAMQTTFNNPDFALVGSTPDEKVNTLVDVLVQTANSAMKEIYRLLGYK